MLRLGVITKNENNVFKNKVKSTIDKAKSAYYKKVFNANIGNIRTTWKTLNNLMGRCNTRSITCLLDHDTEIYDDKKIANLFNDYFTNIPIELDSKIEHTASDPTSFISVNLQSVLSEFEQCTPLEVCSIISNLKITKESKNSIPIQLIISNKETLSVVISDMVNRSIRDCIFPNSLKISRVVPIYKQGDPRIPGNYRPIAISHWLSKIFEKILYSRLMHHIVINDILSPQQFGFRKHISTLNAIINFTEHVYKILNDKSSSLKILIDYSKAFDTVNHEILLRKLDCYGVRDNCLQLLRSYLKDRKQAVNIRDTFSDYKTTNISIPQGSIIGPLAFLLYVNEIPNISSRFQVTMFADDCTLSFANSDINNLINECNEDLARFKVWSNANRLTINTNKTNCLYISNLNESPSYGSICIDEQNLNFVEVTKFLGVFIDNRVKYDKHIDHVRNKISKSIGIMYRIRNFIPHKCLKDLYFAIVHPYVMYRPGREADWTMGPRETPISDHHQS